MSRNLARRLVRKLPLLVVMVTIFVVSHQPGDSLNLPSLPGLDKVAHAVIYGVLAAAALFAFAPYPPDSDRRAVAAGVVMFCLLFGLTDEYHQKFIPGRSACGWDLIADGFGAVMVAGLWWWRTSLRCLSPAPPLTGDRRGSSPFPWRSR